jgi:hypothetical protein
VTLQADITVAVARLAGLQVPSGLDSVVGRPSVAGEEATGMAGLTLLWSENGMVWTYITQFDVAELLPVRLKLEVVALESGVALDAELLLVMAAGAGLGIIECLDGMNLEPVCAVIFRDVVSLVVLG